MSVKCPNCGYVFEPGGAAGGGPSAALIAAQREFEGAAPMRPELPDNYVPSSTELPEDAAALIAQLRQDYGLTKPFPVEELAGGTGAQYATAVQPREPNAAQLAQALRRPRR